MNNCILCGKSLSKGKTNREHYVGQVLIRNFAKLLVPSKYTHALRVDLSEDGGEAVLAPRTAHYDWATVVVHEKCNLDASVVCQDLKYIIDHMDDGNEFNTERIFEYYGRIWNLDPKNLHLNIYSPELTRRSFEHYGDAVELYQPGWLWVGRLFIHDMTMSQKASNEQHTIWLGTKDKLEAIIEELK